VRYAVRGGRLGLALDAHLQRKLRQYFADRGDVEAAVVFGSVARGQARADSDLDVGILPAPSAATGFAHPALTASVDLTARLRRKVDVADLRRADPTFGLVVRQDAALVFEATAGIWASWCAQVAKGPAPQSLLERQREAPLHTVARLRRHQPVTLQQYLEDADLQWAVERVLERAAHCVRAIMTLIARGLPPGEAGALPPDLTRTLSSLGGLLEPGSAIDAKAVLDVLHNHLDEFEAFAAQVVAALHARGLLPPQP